MTRATVICLALAHAAFGQFTATVKSTPRPTASGGTDVDFMSLTVHRGTNTAYRYDFISAYGQADANIISASDRNYLLLKYGEGRGTQSRTEYLVIFEMLDDLIEVIRIPISGYAGPGTLWEYSYDARVTTNALEITLIRSVDHKPGSAIMGLPSDRRRTIRIDRSMNKK